MIESRIAVRTENAATSASASKRSADRAEVVHHPLEPVGASVRLGRRRVREERISGRNPEPARRPRAYAKDRHLPKSGGRPDQPGEDRDARIAANRRCATSRRIVASAPPKRREIPASPSAIPSMIPSAAADPPSEVMNRGRRAVGTSWPRSDSRLAAPMPPTPGVSHFDFGVFVLVVSIGRGAYRGARRLPARAEESLGAIFGATDGRAIAPEGVSAGRSGSPNGVRTRVSTLRVFSGSISLPAALAGSGS